MWTESPVRTTFVLVWTQVSWANEGAGMARAAPGLILKPLLAAQHLRDLPQVGVGLGDVEVIEGDLIDIDDDCPCCLPRGRPEHLVCIEQPLACHMERPARRDLRANRRGLDGARAQMTLTAPKPRTPMVKIRRSP